MFAPDGNAFTASETGRRVPLFFLFRSDVPARSVRGQLESPAASASVAGRNTLSHMNYVVFRYRTGRSLTWSPRRTDSLLDALFVLEQVCTNVRNLSSRLTSVDPGPGFRGLDFGRYACAGARRDSHREEIGNPFIMDPPPWCT